MCPVPLWGQEGGAASSPPRPMPGCPWSSSVLRSTFSFPRSWGLQLSPWLPCLPGQSGLRGWTEQGALTRSPRSLVGAPIPIILVKKWGLGGSKELAQSHTAAGRRTWDGTLEAPCQSLSAVQGEPAWSGGEGRRWGGPCPHCKERSRATVHPPPSFGFLIVLIAI